MRSLLSLFAIPALLSGQASPSNGLDDLSIEQLLEMRVQTATLRKQSLQDAPASVSVITADEIRRYGWRTLGEVLSNVRSFYISSDGPLTYVGARGFSLLGDYNTRFLVLVNGHAMTDNVYSSMYKFGQDFPIDIELVEQIEIVRGPLSALYGGNGLFATVNILTKNGATSSQAKVTAQGGSLGEKKLVASKSFQWDGGNLLIAGTALHGSGRRVVFPELDGAAADHAGAESGYRFFGNFAWKDWTVMASFGEYKSIVPTGWFGTLVGDTGTRDTESRNFLEAAWNRSLGQDATLRWRTYFDQFRYKGIYKYEDDYHNVDGASGDWVGSELVYHHYISDRGTFTTGGQLNVDLRNVQYNEDHFHGPDAGESTENFRIRHPRTSYGFFAQQEWKLSQRWTGYLGGRLDGTTQDNWFFSPRAALVYKKNNKAYKLMYGRAFRNPSTFERYWEPNPDLAAERIDTFEMVREQRINGVHLTASVFHYRLGGLITGVPYTEGAQPGANLQYRNTSKARATGLEMEMSGRPADWLDVAAGFSIQRTRGSAGRVENSPVKLGQLRASIPLAGQRLLLSGAVRYLGSRRGITGGTFSAVTLLDVTATAGRLGRGMELQFGVRNLLDRSYADPLTAEHATQTMPAPGRSVFLRLTWKQD